MSVEINVAKKAILDKLEAQVKTVVAKLDTLKARAEAAKANFEIKAITELLPREQAILQKLQELRKSGEDRWAQLKTDIEAQIADFEKSVTKLESKLKTKAS